MSTATQIRKIPTRVNDFVRPVRSLRKRADSKEQRLISSLLDVLFESEDRTDFPVILHWFSTSLGSDLGKFDRGSPTYLPYLSHRLHERVVEAGHNIDGLCALLGVAMGHGERSGTYRGSHGEDLNPRCAGVIELGVAVGRSLAELNELLARNEIMDRTGVSDEALHVLKDVVDSFDTTMRLRVSDLFPKAQSDELAVGLALLIEPLSLDRLWLALYGGIPDDSYDEYAETKTRGIQGLRDSLKSWFEQGLITEDEFQIRRMYRSPVARGVVALTESGRVYFGDLYRNRIERQVKS